MIRGLDLCLLFALVPLVVQAVETGWMLQGVCFYQGHLDGVFFAQNGTTVDGRPWYKSTTGDHYIYFDSDCSGHGDAPRWVIDGDAPSTTRTFDLDSDGACEFYIERISTETTLPLKADWQMDCEGQGNLTTKELEFWNPDEDHIHVTKPPDQTVASGANNVAFFSKVILLAIALGHTQIL